MESRELIEACQKGQTEAQAEMYKRYYRSMYGVCLFYARDETEAMDMLQDGFIHLFSKIGKYGFRGSFEGWMRKLFVNQILQKFRSKKLLYSTGIDGIEEGFSTDNIIDNITADDLLAIIRELSPQYRLVFNLYAIEGYNHKEIAAKLGITAGTSKSNLSRARQLLQQKVKERFPDHYKTRANGK